MSPAKRPPVVNDGSPEKTTFARKHLERHEFAQRIYRLILSKGWSQADLARAAGVQRESVSNYVNGTSLPDSKNLARLAKAFGVKPEELMPNISENAYERDMNPSLEIKASNDDPSKSWVRLNREVSTTTVLKIMQALEEDQSAAKGSR